ncbi:hypothetical protein [Secundilactobacillus kimchicus]|uniref:hypothetical protein n=1 Tax=Secundilactobacillus kimchicus TaxID=528209 RepID=UPI0024A9F6B8|nr:hypothetical protein [Secundilactobacillus kimchicus]
MGLYYADGKGNATPVIGGHVPAGTVLWQGSKGFLDSYDSIKAAAQWYPVPTSSDILINQTINLGENASKLKTGLVINANRSQMLMAYISGSSNWSKVSTNNNNVPTVSVVAQSKLTNAMIQAGTSVKIATGGGGFTVSAKIVDSNKLEFSVSGPNAAVNSTLCAWNDSTTTDFYRAVVIIDSITAY